MKKQTFILDTLEVRDLKQYIKLGKRELIEWTKFLKLAEKKLLKEKAELKRNAKNAF